MPEFREIILGQQEPDPQAKLDPAWLRGTCPMCGEAVVSNCYYVTVGGKRSYIIVWECWAALAEPPTCDFREVK